MRFIVFGAGATGSVLAAELTSVNEEVGVIARGEHLARMRESGLSYRSLGGEQRMLTMEVGTEAEVPAGDLVLVTLKSYALGNAAPAIRRVCRPDGMVVFLQNGFPWWYFRDLDGPYHGRRISSLDPKGLLMSSLTDVSIAGGVVTLAASLLEPGRVQHTAANHFDIGRPDCQPDVRLTALGSALANAGFEVALPGDPRPAVWTKLAVNVGLNGVAALTGANIGAMWDDDYLRPLIHELIGEARQIAAALGCPINLDLEQRRRTAARTHRSSTLQDIEAGRPIEHEALFGVLVSIADELQLPIPHIRTVSALLRRRAIETGCLSSQ
jgi:2-dehydropantoate 2-reductase